MDLLKIRSLQFSTKAIHAGTQVDPSTGAIMPPIVLSSTFAQRSPGVPIGKFEYSRTANPTRESLEANLAALENGNFGLCFSSGCAAMSTVLQLLPSGSHVILSDDVYGGTQRLVANVFSEYGISHTLCDLTNLTKLEAALLPNTRLIWLETPSNPLLKILDITAINNFKKQKAPNILLAVDNTFATPYLQNPLDIGADIVCHSTTKYLGGHSDILGGALIVNDEKLYQKLAYLQNAIGAVPSPMDCFLLLRSTKTLAIRMKSHCHNAKLIAEFLSKHSKIKKVIYPGLTNHPQHVLASNQMRDFGGMISVVLKEDLSSTLKFLKNLQLFTLAESLGGVESLIEHPGLMTHAGIPLEHRQRIGIEESMVRLSVGIEDPEDLIHDLEQALDIK